MWRDDRKQPNNLKIFLSLLSHSQLEALNILSTTHYSSELQHELWLSLKSSDIYLSPKLKTFGYWLLFQSSKYSEISLVFSFFESLETAKWLLIPQYLGSKTWSPFSLFSLFFLIMLWQPIILLTTLCLPQCYLLLVIWSCPDYFIFSDFIM